MSGPRITRGPDTLSSISPSFGGGVALAAPAAEPVVEPKANEVLARRDVSPKELTHSDV